MSGTIVQGIDTLTSAMKGKNDFSKKWKIKTPVVNSNIYDFQAILFRIKNICCKVIDIGSSILKS